MLEDVAVQIEVKLKNVGQLYRQTSWIFHTHYSCDRHKEPREPWFHIMKHLLLFNNSCLLSLAHVPGRLLCSASWTCGASCCRRWGAGTWRQTTCAAIRGYSWSTERKTHAHFTQNPSIKAYRKVFNVCAMDKMSHLESKLAIVVRPKLYALLSEKKKTILINSFVLLKAIKGVIFRKRCQNVPNAATLWPFSNA